MVSWLPNGMADGVMIAMSAQNVIYCILGVTVGMVVGVLPGVGVLTTIALLMPLTFYIDPMTAITMLAGIYYGAVYGGSTAAILLNIPGTASAAVTTLDGYPMAKQGRAGVALFMTTIASFVGSVLGIVLLAAFAFPLARFALEFRSQELFALMFLALVMSSMISSGSALKAFAMVAFGLLAGSVGTDVSTGVHRFTFGAVPLYSGLSLVAIALGLFGLAELIRSANAKDQHSVVATDISMKAMLPTRDDWRRSWMPMLRGTAVGSFFGALPGTGGTVAAFVSYLLERRISRHPERFGQGAIEGIAAPEAANNSAIPTAFIPLLSMGIPGDAILALVLGVLMIHGVSPGPLFMANEPDMFWSIVVSFLLANALLLILNIPLIGVWVRILAIPQTVLLPSIVGLLCIGVYSVSYQVADLYVLVGFGIAGYLLALLHYPIAPFLLGFVLGPMMEENFRRAMALQNGDLLGFFHRPISAVILTLVIVILAATLVLRLRSIRRVRVAAATSD